MTKEGQAMRRLSGFLSRRILPILVAGLGIACCCCPAWAQEAPATAQSPADLEKRVRELEAIVRQLQAEREVKIAAPAPAPTPDAAPAPANPPGEARGPDAAANPDDGPGQGGGGGDRGGASAGGIASQSPTVSGGRAAGRQVGSDLPASILAGWDNGFFIRDPENHYRLRITGQVQTDYRDYLNNNDRVDVDSFLIRRARLGVEADMYDYYEFRLLPDFSNAQGPGAITANERIQDAYVNVHYWDSFQVELGKFKQPFSYEQLVQDRYVPTMERSLFDQRVPARDIGVMAHGQRLLCDRLDYYISFYNGESNNDYDNNNNKDFAARLVIRPFNSDSFAPALHLLQFGMSATTGMEQEVINLGGAPANFLRTPANVPWFQYTAGTRADGVRNRLSPEVTYFYKALGVAAQYYYEDQRIRGPQNSLASNVLLDLPMNGFYGMATLLLTGEERTTYSQQIRPLRPFDPTAPFANPGAWELVGRASRLDLGKQVFQVYKTGPAAANVFSFSDPTLYTRGATEMTLGMNWYLNPWVRMQLNWEHAWFDQLERPGGITAGVQPSGLISHQDTIYTRFQLIF